MHSPVSRKMATLLAATVMNRRLRKH